MIGTKGRRMNVTALDSPAAETITIRDSGAGCVTEPDSLAVSAINTRYARHRRRRPTPLTDEQRVHQEQEQVGWSARCEASAAETPTRAKLAELAHRTGAVCGRSGGPLLVTDPVWFVRLSCGPCGSVRRQAPVCRTCAPPSKVTPPWTCAICQRPVGGRRRPRGRVCCSETCRWRWYNAQRKARAAPERLKVCRACGQSFQARRRDATTCSSACRQRAYRQRQGAHEHDRGLYLRGPGMTEEERATNRQTTRTEETWHQPTA